jgi:hypothetical protein
VRCPRIGPELRPARLEGEFVERLVDALHLVDGDRIGAHPPLDLAEALVVGLLEGIERRHELVEGLADFARSGGAAPPATLVS